MQVFHYVANELRRTPLFETDYDTSKTPEEAAVYNDFDNEDPFANIPSSSTILPIQLDTSNNPEEPIITQREVDYALIEGDREESIFYQELSFELEFYDIHSKEPDQEYRLKVYSIMKYGGISYTDDVVRIYQM